MDVHTRPTSEAATYRALALVSVLFRNNLERELASEQRPRGVVEKLHTLLREWMDRENVRAHLSRREQAMMEAPLAGWDERVVAETSWRIEGVGALLWALGPAPEMAPYDTLFELEAVVPTLHVFESTAPVLASLRLRPEADIDRQRDLAEIWHWRARTAELQRRSGLQPAPQNLMAALDRAKAAGATIPEGGDLHAFGKLYRDLSPEELTLCGTIARERHHALNWLCGRSADWDDASADT